ncbi:MAG: PilN domain-containing protein [Candidatus Moraniibacteriota bacterium]
MRLQINLLSPERKQQATDWQWFRFVINQCVNVGMLAVLVFGILWGIGWMLNQRLMLLDISAGDKQNVQTTKDLEGYQKEIQAVNATTQKTITRENKQPKWSKLFEKMESLVSAEIVLDSVTNADYQVTITGQADNRDALMSFRDRLAQDGCFDDVRLPLSNLFSQEKVIFQIEVIIHTECLKVPLL